ncbi:uncharacterized protein LOC111019212 [Momordica charantia]|uniref:Uncharacterized protein LOC111019212 n=1 Tax=Momordica charantia TaxID=3673 RepID=A0A6J1DAN1_MOMCH|nr:uncharacterized protein LOC111019212 [Momordica charantia]XP_022151239.1 uncharacterized protein LOC111019212 [Momordica charantia]XP_022151240.1 uncharacterized protein LOC111019212 [Momordica charantia]XP_022151241.1 uncharacterized protein LOC111019212 [Momordica charantia]
MAIAFSFSLPLDLPLPHHHRLLRRHFIHHQTFPSLPTSSSYPFPRSLKPENHTFKTSSLNSSLLEDPLRTGRFLTNDEFEKLKLLGDFRYFQELESGSLSVRVMRDDELDATVGLLAESFAESMLWPSGYISLLRFLVKQYLTERRALMPHAATLIGFYKGKDEDEQKPEQLAGTVEVFFDKRGANASPPTPTPPKNSPYICNMTVKKELRRRGIGWHLLKAGEEMISQMSTSREVYLHCRMIDTAPFNMYTKAGYSVVQTDTVLILLMLQRRKHLMCKKLPAMTMSSPSESDVPFCLEE